MLIILPVKMKLFSFEGSICVREWMVNQCIAMHIAQEWIVERLKPKILIF